MGQWDRVTWKSTARGSRRLPRHQAGSGVETEDTQESSALGQILLHHVTQGQPAGLSSPRFLFLQVGTMTPPSLH